MIELGNEHNLHEIEESQYVLCLDDTETWNDHDVCIKTFSSRRHVKVITRVIKSLISEISISLKAEVIFQKAGTWVDSASSLLLAVAGK